MSELIRGFYLILYVWRFLAEQGRRRQSRDWPVAAAETVDGSIVSRHFPCLVAITYSYHVMGEVRTGSLYRRCLRRSSALSLIDQAKEPGLEVRYDPEHPERSYLPLPLGIGGFAFAFPITVLFITIIALIVSGFIRDHYNDKHSSVPADQWRTLTVDPVFTAQFPGLPYQPVPLNDVPHDTGWQPWNKIWVVWRDHQYFQIRVLPLNCGQPSEPYFRQVMAQMQRANPKPYLYKRDRIQLQGRPGLDLQYTRPYSRLEVFVNNDAAYILSSNGAITRDLNHFFDSFHFMGDAPPCLTSSTTNSTSHSHSVPSD